MVIPTPALRPGCCPTAPLNHALCAFTAAAGETPVGRLGPSRHHGTFLAGGIGRGAAHGVGGPDGASSTDPQRCPTMEPRAGGEAL